MLRTIILIFVLLMSLPFATKAQRTADTITQIYPSQQIEDFMNGTQPAFRTFTEVSFFGNDNCFHCVKIKQLLDQYQIEYTFYDINKNKDYYNLMLQLVNKVDKGNRKFVFPVVLVNEKIYYSIKNIEEFVDGIKNLQ